MYAMASWQFDSHLNHNQTVSIPPEVASQLTPDTPVHVVLITGVESEDADWDRLTAEQFLQGYASGDEIYDNLPEG
jgi:hypothetical protein